MEIIIYKITILSTNKSYIGRTNNLVRRISQHKHAAKTHSHSRKGMYIDWIKHGLESNFRVDVLERFEYLSDEDANYRESLYIAKYDTEFSGYNTTYYGSKFRVSPLKGHALPPERKAKFLETAVVAQPGRDNVSAKRYYIIDNYKNEYTCECRTDIMNKLGLSLKQTKGLISLAGKWYTPRKHVDNKYVNSTISYMLLKVEHIN